MSNLTPAEAQREIDRIEREELLAGRHPLHQFWPNDKLLPLYEVANNSTESPYYRRGGRRQ